MNKIKMVVGIDVSMEDFHACINVRSDDGSVKIKGTRTFQNTSVGFKELIQWVLGRKKDDCTLSFVMEATGVYYEDLADFLYSSKEQVSVVLANKIKNYAKSINVKTKTDKVDSKIIADFGMERKLDMEAYVTGLQRVAGFLQGITFHKKRNDQGKKPEACHDQITWKI